MEANQLEVKTFVCTGCGKVYELPHSFYSLTLPNGTDAKLCSSECRDSERARIRVLEAKEQELKGNSDPRLEAVTPEGVEKVNTPTGEHKTIGAEIEGHCRCCLDSGERIAEKFETAQRLYAFELMERFYPEKLGANPQEISKIKRDLLFKLLQISQPKS